MVPPPVLKKTRFISPWRMVGEFIRLETSAGILLLSAAVLAVIIANTPLQHYYHALFHTPVPMRLISWRFVVAPIEIVNDFFMAVFFLLVGLEIKREICQGELNSLDKIGLPGFAAFGGMLVPALIFVLLNWQDKQALRGWAIPTATDIAFALGIIALLGKRVPLSIKLFLMALAIFDDIGAILIIAIFYQSHIVWLALAGAIVCVLTLVILNISRVRSLSCYLAIGLALWFFMLKSGIHPTLAGVLLALTIPLKSETPALRSPLHKLEQRLHPMVAYMILPLFSFANAGVAFELPLHQLFSPLSLGIMLGLLLGKQIGIFGAVWLVIKNRWAALPKGANWLSLYGVSLLAGVGFTMSLFIGLLAYGNEDSGYPVYVRFGVFTGSLLSGALGYILLRKAAQS